MKNWKVISLVALGIFGAAFLSASAITCTNTFPTSLNAYTSVSCIASSWANALENKMGITGSTSTSTLDYQINHIFTSYGSEIVQSTSTTGLLKTASNGSDIQSTSTFRSNLGLTDTAIISSSTWYKVANNGADITSTSTFRSNLGLTDTAVTASSSFAKSSITVSAGSNLTGGGDLTANRTLAVTTTPSFTSVTIPGIVNSLVGTDGNGKLIATTTAISVDQTANYNWSGTHTFTNVVTITGSSTLASTTFNNIPTAPTSTPTLATQLTTKNYVGSLLPVFGNSTTTSKTFSGGFTNLATSTFTLSTAGRVLVIGSGSVSNATAGDGCSLSITVDAATPSDVPSVNYDITSATPTSMPMSIFYITASLSAAAHSIQLVGTNLVGGTCTPANYTFQTQYIGT